MSLATPSVISLLLHNLFNASISSEHIPKDTYEWDSEAVLPYSLAPPSISLPSNAVGNLQDAGSSGGAASPSKKRKTMESGNDGDSQDVVVDKEGEKVPKMELEDEEQPVQSQEDQAAVDEGTMYQETGCWVHKVTREPLGGSDGIISFTVIGLTIANSMISVHGSLLSDPQAALATKKATDSGEGKKHHRQQHQHQQQRKPEATDARLLEEQQDDSDSDDDSEDEAAQVGAASDEVNKSSSSSKSKIKPISSSTKLTKSISSSPNKRKKIGSVP